MDTINFTKDEAAEALRGKAYKTIGVARRQLMKLYPSHHYLALSYDGQLLLDRAFGSLNRLLKEIARKETKHF